MVNEYLTSNRIFDSSLHRDNCVDRFVLLKRTFEEKGYNLSTQDINTIEESDFVIYAANMPKILPAKGDVDKSFIILSESAFIRPDNYDVEKHQCFNKVFTWADDLVDDAKYIKLNYAHAFPQSISRFPIDEKKLCVLIAGNKKPKTILEDELLKLNLYSEREKAIRWFEANHLQDFDLYGMGWDKFYFSGPRFVSALNRFPLLAKLYLNASGKYYPSYRGMVEHKKPVMEKYKFSICYENARDIPGYITEKIFDSFFAGNVPIYWGAQNVTDFIPEDCFIDKRKFSSYEKLHAFLKPMPNEVYNDYLNNIENYLKSEQAMQYKSEGFVDTIVATILKSESNR